MPKHELTPLTLRPPRMVRLGHAYFLRENLMPIQLDDLFSSFEG